MDGQDGITNPVGMLGAPIEVDVHVVHGNLNRLQNAIRTVKGLQLEVDDIVFNGLASSLALLTSEQKELGSVVIDIGGGIREISTKFWEELMNYEVDNEKLFLDHGNDYKLLNNNPKILQSDHLFVLGKILFWMFIHGGAWPTWLHPFHINFIMEKDINTVEIFEELQPNLCKLAKKITVDNSSYDEIKNWWINYRDIGVVSIVT